jgi:hypothetical protein
MLCTIVANCFAEVLLANKAVLLEEEERVVALDKSGRPKYQQGAEHVNTHSAQFVGKTKALNGDSGKKAQKSKFYNLAPGAIALLGFQNDGFMPTSLSFFLVDPIPKGIKVKFVVGRGFFRKILQEGPILELHAETYLRSGAIITWTSPHRSAVYPVSMSIKLTNPDPSAADEVGMFTQLRPFPQKLGKYQVYIYAGLEERPVFVFGMTTQTAKPLPRALKRGESAIVMKRLSLDRASSITPTNFVFCPHLKCDGSNCACSTFTFTGDRAKVLGVITFAKNWFGGSRARSFPSLQSGWPMHLYTLKCSDCESWVCKHTTCVYDGAMTEVQGYVWSVIVFSPPSLSLSLSLSPGAGVRIGEVLFDSFTVPPSFVLIGASR